MLGDVVLAASVFLVGGVLGQAISRTGIEVVAWVPIEVDTEVTINLSMISLSLAALVASGLAATAHALGMPESFGWAIGIAVAGLGLTALVYRFGLRVLSHEVDLVRMRRRRRAGLPPLPEGPPRHSK